jgi:transmembrane sensor
VRRWLTIPAIAASLLVVAAASLLALGVLFAPGAQEYSTARGEQRSIVLSDGSIVQLNTLSRLIVRFDEGVRRIELPEGEALFRAAHDAARPFLVATPTATVRAIGTEFNVYSRSRDTEVAVLEGRVGVTAGAAFDRKDPLAAGSTAPIVLGARESIVLDARGRASRAGARGPDEAVSWTRRRLVFDDAPVARVVEEFNRYNAKQLQVRDPRIAMLRISGVFDADDPDALVKYLERIQGIEVPGSFPTIPLEPRSGRATP